jgi:2-amino-4-hydroxy-6-hydroxymethyldihydropteridine diphosphokinase
MDRVYILLGSNLGDRKKMLDECMRQIEKDIGTILIRSSVYETEPWGEPDQPWYLNQAIGLDISLEPLALLEKLQQIEIQLGRERKGKQWQPRTIDIDIVLYNDMVLETRQLTIPHPWLHRRRFALVPLAEIAGEEMHPVFRRTISDLVRHCDDPLQVVLQTEYLIK